MTRAEKLEQIAGLARSVRDAQRRYFAVRTGQNLALAKTWEGRLDTALRELDQIAPAGGGAP